MEDYRKKEERKEKRIGCCWGIYIIVFIAVGIFSLVSDAVEDFRDRDKTVYITNTGSKYHKGDCKWLEYSKIPITEKEAIRKGYDDCEVCDP